jgi:hypothetical protein
MRFILIVLVGIMATGGALVSPGVSTALVIDFSAAGSAGIVRDASLLYRGTMHEAS